MTLAAPWPSASVSRLPPGACGSDPNSALSSPLSAADFPCSKRACRSASDRHGRHESSGSGASPLPPRDPVDHRQLEPDLPEPDAPLTFRRKRLAELFGATDLVDRGQRHRLIEPPPPVLERDIDLQGV